MRPCLNLTRTLGHGRETCCCSPALAYLGPRRPAPERRAGIDHSRTVRARCMEPPGGWQTLAGASSWWCSAVGGRHARLRVCSRTGAGQRGGVGVTPLLCESRGCASSFGHGDAPLWSAVDGAGFSGRTGRGGRSDRRVGVRQEGLTCRSVMRLIPQPRPHRRRARGPSFDGRDDARPCRRRSCAASPPRTNARDDLPGPVQLTEPPSTAIREPEIAEDAERETSGWARPDGPGAGRSELLDGRRASRIPSDAPPLS